MSSISYIFVRFKIEGIHYWADAPENRSYLASMHRHLFYVEVRCNVSHDDREIEFYDLLDTAKSLFIGGNMGNSSCEKMARNLATELVQRYQRSFTVEVS